VRRHRRQRVHAHPPARMSRHRPAGGWRGGRAKPRLWLRPPEAAGAMDGPAAVTTSQVCSPRITSSGPPSRHMTTGNAGKWRDAATDGHAVGGHAARRDTTGDCCDSCDKPRFHDTSRRQRPSSWPGWGRSFRSSARGCGDWGELVQVHFRPGDFSGPASPGCYYSWSSLFDRRDHERLKAASHAAKA
jgi:hypothetical protein